MTKFAKCLVVFAVGASFAFLGFAWVSMMGGPNWDAEAAALPGYEIAKSQDGKWTVKDRTTGQNINVAPATVRAAAIVAARKDLADKQDAEAQKLSAPTAAYKKKLDEARKLNQADVKAMEARVQQLNTQLVDLNTKILGLSGEVVKRSLDAQAIRTEATKRREDVFRLTRELREIHTDYFRSEELERKLRDQLVRLDGVIASLETRNQQLRESVGNSGGYSPRPPL
jgi:predicted RNase H-like nuclease (RuvC/YqgF family)